MNGSMSHKVNARHLQRLAYLYVRQSTLRQVLENTESTARQYALRERAVALGWPHERVITIDADLGQSGASAVDRAGFQHLVAEVGLAHVGIVLGLEVSRLARSSSDWHQLLEICALTGTLILDEDGIYDPTAFNDRLLLGLKGTMSEAELHVLQARLRGGILNKASRGALRLTLPVGFVYADDEQVILNPDQQVQQAIRLFFATLRQTGSVYRTMRTFRDQGLLFPRHLQRGPQRGEVFWAPLRYDNALAMVHNPCYAGAYAFGRTRTYKTVGGRIHIEHLPREEWHTLLREAHAGYISWEEHEEQLRRLCANRLAYGSVQRLSPPREGPALLQGLVLCGWCGNRMSVRYHARKGQPVPDYVCQDEHVHHGGVFCQRVPGKDLDRAVSAVLIAAVTPLALEVALAVQDEIGTRAAEAERLRQQQVERAQYEADLARRRFLRVDPDHRLVADALEAEWNAKLRDLAAVRDEVERQRQRAAAPVSEEQRAAIRALATDFPRLWHDPKTPDRERKRMAALLIEDVTLLKADQITAHIRFKGGVTQTITVALAPPIGELRTTERGLLQEIDRLLDTHTDGEVAAALNARGLRTIDGTPFCGNRIYQLRRAHGLRDRCTRLRAQGMLTIDEAAQAYGVTKPTLTRWGRTGRVQAMPFNDKGECLFMPPDEQTPAKRARQWLPWNQRISADGRGAV